MLKTGKRGKRGKKGKKEENKTEWSLARPLKWAIFIVQKLTLHKNWVEFYQQFNGAIRTSLTAQYIARRR